MHRIWTHLQRLVASIMLVALTSLMIQGSAGHVMPRHSAISAGAHHHHQSAHDHAQVGGPATSASQAGADLDSESKPPEHHGPGACCGAFCAAAVPLLPAQFTLSRTETGAVLPAFDINGQGISSEGLRRPPRTPDIA